MCLREFNAENESPKSTGIVHIEKGITFIQFQTFLLG
jgi:hypothetical protein